MDINYLTKFYNDIIQVNLNNDDLNTIYVIYNSKWSDMPNKIRRVNHTGVVIIQYPKIYRVSISELTDRVKHANTVKVDNIRNLIVLIYYDYTILFPIFLLNEERNKSVRDMVERYRS